MGGSRRLPYTEATFNNGVPVGFVDRYGRVHDDIRISVTDRCNLRCSYCMPVKPEWFPRSEILDYEELIRLVRVVRRRGVRKVRVTGGEPLVRKNLTTFIRSLSEIMNGEVSLSTNGLLLEAMAESLAQAGLRRINVSLDSLIPERYAKLTRRDSLGQVLRGIAKAASVGLTPIKVNTVLLRGVNEDEVESLVEHSRNHGWEIRFIEFMPIENGSTWQMERVITGQELRRRIDSVWPLVPDPAADPHAPASRYLFRDGRGAVGFIDSVSRPFCSDCNRLRITADGKFCVCLYDDTETDLRAPLRSGASDDELEELMERAVKAKGRGGAVEVKETRSRLRLSRTMHQIGG